MSTFTNLAYWMTRRMDSVATGCTARLTTRKSEAGSARLTDKPSVTSFVHQFNGTAVN